MGLIAIDKFIREDLVEPFPKLGKQGKVVYLRDFERENLIHKRDLLQGKNLEELVSEIPSLVSKETRAAAIRLVEEVCRHVRMGKTVESEPVKNMIKDILDEILNNYKKAMVRLAALKSFDEYTFTHSVNVTVLSVVMGIELGLSRKELEELALGAMFHDLGKIKIGYQILNKQGSLTSKEFERIKKHPLEGYKIVMNDPESSEITKLVARHHHERQDGTGYPDGLKEDQINNYAAIVAVADVYDALTADRPYRKALAPYEAMKTIIVGSKRHFNQKIVETFLDSMSIYPQGSFVRLNTGEMAIVTRTNRKAVIRPVIKLLVDGSGEKFKESVEIDLLTQPHRYITGYVNGEFFKDSKQ
ncbi:HD-GYP domain-containing protein [bacterium]|nr:HD-GYP domain-containing protein [bacterium]